MATIDNKNIIDELIKNNGYYEDDPQAYQIVEYINAYGNTTWGVTWINEVMQRRHRYELETPYVRSPKVIWKAYKK
jgi:hypothetical protein